MSVRNEKEVVIIGGGPAGMSAAIWCAELGLDAILIDEKNAFGGQLFNVFNPIVNYPGIAEIGSAELRRAISDQVSSSTTEAVIGCAAAEVDLGGKTVLTTDGRTVTFEALIIATGVRRRTLGVHGEEDFLHKGILTSGVGEKAMVAGKRIVIVGGGDAAFENAVILSDNAESVTLVHRRQEFSARNEFVDQARSRDNINIRYQSTVQEFTGDDWLSGVVVRDADDRTTRIETDFALVRIGVTPNSSIFEGQISLDSDGYIRVGSDCSTSMANIYAVGDVTNSNSPTIASAVGTGATAAKNICRNLKFDV